MHLRLAVLASGSGTTLQNILDRIATGQLPASVELVVSDNPEAFALERARTAGIDARFIPFSKSNAEAFSTAVFDLCRQSRVELVVLAGFLKLLRIPPDFAQKVINVHPALIPAFCGKGYYGSRVHQAVLDAGAKQTGCTVHFCDNEYDHGPIILQQVVSVEENDTAETLAKRVQAAEREALPAAIRLFAEGRVSVVDDQVRVRP